MLIGETVVETVSKSGTFQEKNTLTDVLMVAEIVKVVTKMAEDPSI